MELKGPKARLQKEIKVCFDRASKRLRKASGNWTFDRRLMMGEVGPKPQAGIAEPYGLFRSLVSNIFVSVPEVYCEAKKPDQQEIAAFLGDATNYDFEIGHLYGALKRAIWRAFPYGIGYVAENVETVHEYDKKGEKVGIGKQFFNFINPPNSDVLVDPDGFRHDLFDHRFTFMAYYLSIDEFVEKKDEEGKPFYSNYDKEKLDQLPAANERTKGPEDARWQQVLGMGSRVQQESNPKYKQIKLWKQYDRIGTEGAPMVYHILDATKKLVAEEEWPVPIEIQGKVQFPFKVFVFGEEAEDFYPASEVALIRPQIVNKIRLNDQYITDMCDKLRGYVGLSPYVDDKKMGKLIKSQGKPVFIITSNIDVLAQSANAPKIDSAQDAIGKLQDVTPDVQLPQAMALVDGQMQNIMGYGFPSRGGLPAIRSAKEAARVADAMQRSLLDRQTTIERFTRECALYHALLLKAVTPEDAQRYFRITDKISGLKTWLSYNPKDIPNEEDICFDVYVGSSTPQSLDAKRASTLQEISVMWPLAKEAGMSPAPFVYKYAQVFGVKHADQFMKNQKGAAMELLAVTTKAAQMGGSKESAQMLIQATMNMINAILNPAEKQAVFQAMQKQAEMEKPKGIAQMDSVAEASSNVTPFKAQGNPPGAMDLGNP